MNRAFLQQLAEERRLDAASLLAAQRWSGAYYMIGYAAECGLKSCLVHYIGRTGAIYADRKYATGLKDCWTHKLGDLVTYAGLDHELEVAIKADPVLGGYWGVALQWTETSRYQNKSQADAEILYEAITQEPSGVLRWIRTHW